MKTGFSVASAAIVFAVAIGFAPAAMAQQNPSAASGKAGVCASCHGINGVSSNPLYPNLAGQHLEYLLKSLTAYRDGERQDSDYESDGARVERRRYRGIVALLRRPIIAYGCICRSRSRNHRAAPPAAASATTKASQSPTRV